MGWYSTIAMFSTCISLIVAVSLYIPRSFGYKLRIRRISIRYLQNISYSSQKRSWDIKSIRVTFHWPQRLSPYWAIVIADDFNYEDEECDVALKRLEAKLWIFPVFFRFTAGPWIDTTLDGLKIHVRSSDISPWWVSAIRNNLLSTLLVGETIRLHNLTTKIYLGSSPAKPPISDSDTEDEEPNEEEPNEEEPNEDSEESNEEDQTEDPAIEEGINSNELRARGAASQWQMVSPWNSRIYSFDHLEAELRRSWSEESGSFSLIAMNSRWIKVPAYSRMDVYTRSSELWQIFRGVYRFPLNLYRIYYDPMSILNISAPQCDVIFDNFRIRDAELLKQGALKLKQEYCDFEIRHPGIMQEIAWDVFVNTIPSLFEDYLDKV